MRHSSLILVLFLSFNYGFSDSEVPNRKIRGGFGFNYLLSLEFLKYPGTTSYHRNWTASLGYQFDEKSEVEYKFSYFFSYFPNPALMDKVPMFRDFVINSLTYKHKLFSENNFEFKPFIGLSYRSGFVYSRKSNYGEYHNLATTVGISTEYVLHKNVSIALDISHMYNIILNYKEDKTDINNVQAILRVIGNINLGR